MQKCAGLDDQPLYVRDLESFWLCFKPTLKNILVMLYHLESKISLSTELVNVKTNTITEKNFLLSKINNLEQIVASCMLKEFTNNPHSRSLSYLLLTQYHFYFTLSNSSGSLSTYQTHYL